MTETLAVCGGDSGEVRIFNLSSFSCVHAIDATRYHKSLVHINKVEVSGNQLGVAGNPWIRIHAFDNIGAPGTLYEGHSDNVTSLSFQSDHKWFVSTGEDAKLRLWDLRARGFQLGLCHDAAINCSQVHPNQGVVVFGDQNGCLNHLDLAANKVIRQQVGEPLAGLGVTSLLFDEFQRLLCCHHNSCVSIFEGIDTQKELGINLHVDEPFSSGDDSSPRHALMPPALLPLMSRSVSNTRATNPDTVPGHQVVKIADVSGGHTFADDVHAGCYVTSMSLSPSGGKHTRALALSASDGSSSIWRRACDEDACSLDLHVQSLDRIWCCDTKLIDSKARYAISAFADGKCKVIDVARPGGQSLGAFDAGRGKAVRSIALVHEDSMRNRI